MSGPVTSVARVEDVQIFLKDPVYVGDRGSTVVKAMYYKSEVTGSIPAGVIGIFH